MRDNIILLFCLFAEQRLGARAHSADGARSDGGGLESGGSQTASART